MIRLTPMISTVITAIKTGTPIKVVEVLDPSTLLVEELESLIV